MNDVPAAYGCGCCGGFAVKCFQMFRQSFDSVVNVLPICVDHPDLRARFEPRPSRKLRHRLSHISRELATVYADEKIEKRAAQLP